MAAKLLETTLRSRISLKYRVRCNGCRYGSCKVPWIMPEAGLVVQAGGTRFEVYLSTAGEADAAADH